MEQDGESQVRGRCPDRLPHGSHNALEGIGTNIGRTMLIMTATTLVEADFKKLNGERLSTLKTLLADAQRATELCDRWLASGHVADYRAWQTQLRHIDAADEQYQKIRERIRSSS